MSLPKRDGVHDRYYLIHKPDTSPEVLAEADLCIQDVLNGTARENHSAYPTVVRNHNGTPFLPDQLLERYLSKLPLKGFPYEEAVVFCDALRRLVGWQEIRYTLEKYIEKQVQERFFLVGERDDGFTVFPPCTVWPELRPEDVDEGLLHFVCYVAVCCTVYGQSFESLKTEHILGLVSQLRPDMVKQLKTNGSGKLPKGIQWRKTEHFTASANDAFATIHITARDSTEECYAEILDYLCAVLEQEEFPRSYSVEFRGKEKIYLPIPGLPKKGINQLFACAVQHPDLHPAIERYARLAMREYEYYENFADEFCVMPGTFAVFALGLEGEQWAPLVVEYLDLCDDEHSSLQEKFLHALIRKFGFQAWTLGVLVRGALSMQWLKPAKEFRSLIANGESLDALLEIKGHLEYYLAVFALGLEGPKWWRLVCDYMNRCDDEHSSLQEKFIHTFFKQYGFTAQSLPVLVHGVQSMQNLEPAKEFCTLIANKESLDAQLEIKGQLEYYLSEESGSNKRALDYLWRDVLWAIWGKDSENGGSKVIKSAPKELKEKYQQVFA